MYIADEKRYEKITYNQCGKSGLFLPAVSLGLWHNFGSCDKFDNMVEMVCTAFDSGITHFDIANNYGPYPGSAEENFGKIMKTVFAPYRDELIVSSKAGYYMWPGPYGDHGSRKYLIASIDQSLKRTGLEYFDIFYHHRPCPNTPLEETVEALGQIVRSGKALYVGVSNYPADKTREIARLMKEKHIPFVIHQPRYNMFDRWIEDGLQDVLAEEGLGSIAFCPLAQGLLTNKYLTGIPKDSRATKSQFLTPDRITDEKRRKAAQLNEIAAKRGQSLAQMALAWCLRGGKLTSVLIGASRASQITENVKALENTGFTAEELKKIEDIIA